MTKELEKLLEEFEYAVIVATTRFRDMNRLAAAKKAVLDHVTNSRGREDEAVAKLIYEGWKNIPGWVPWVDGGNSDKQMEARRLVPDVLRRIR